MKLNIKKTYQILILFFILISSTSFLLLEEGMFPLSEIDKLDLKKAGLRISTNEIFNSDGKSLVNALVDVGGCTGSFISENGLILTNHHCVFSAVQSLSDTINNYIDNGIIATDKTKEIPAKGMRCKIIISYEDISKEIISKIDTINDFTQRNKVLQSTIKDITNREYLKDSTIVSEVSEMFIGKTYILFKYKILKDIRIVYVPPRNIGEFGGESDNWVWPRHTGDFSLIRAYIGKNGESNSYSKDNIPFTPRNYLKINRNGIRENDFVFILGYPGRTFRHYPSGFLKYHQDILLPFISDFYRWQINYLSELSKNDKKSEIEFSARIKSLANVEKNYLGKLKGFSRLNLVKNKIDEENALQKFINSNENYKKRYGNTLEELNKIYSNIYADGKKNLIISQLIRFSKLISNYTQLIHYLKYVNNPKSTSEPPVKDKNMLLDNILSSFSNMNKNSEFEIISELLYRARNIQDFNLISNKYSKNEIKELLNDPKYYDSVFIKDLTEKGYTKYLNNYDFFLKLAFEIRNYQEQGEKNNLEWQGAINKLSADLYDIKKIWQDRNFIPDANSTLRFTFGYVKGYSPADGIYYSPISYLKGMIEKSINGKDYAVNQKIKELFENKIFADYYDKNTGDIPVAFLYDMDTTGGNSGSPVMDAYGRLVGLNFDRAFEATINDYKWSESYSRSIGVDIRFIIWTLDKVSNAQNILEEFNIK